ncbi:MAG TPA: hypothetical protein VFC79_00805 [Tissierellaceae bacterium]|nr:hypothetical protein [Tissierellaceae bacterium]
MANINLKMTMDENKCKRFIDDIFMNSLGVDFDYVLQAVKEKSERDARKGCLANNTNCSYLHEGICNHPLPQLLNAEDRWSCGSYK